MHQCGAPAPRSPDLASGVTVSDGASDSSREWFRALAESSRDIVLVRDAAGMLSYCSPAVWTSLGYRPEDLEGTNERDLIHPVDLAIRDGLIARLLETDVAQPPAELRIRNKSGVWRWFETIDTNCLENPAVRGIVTNARDITERKAAEVELIELSLHDPLTGLPNRLLVMDRLSIALARTARANDMIAVLFCDLDAFKVVNDSVGHEGGDRVLIEVARRFKRALREADTIARTGGDEFVVVCEGLSGVEDATTLGARIRDFVEQPIAFDDFEAAVSVSIGIVTVVRLRSEHDRSADPAPQRRRRDVPGQARRQSALGALRRERRLRHRLELEPELRRALGADEFVLHYQPVYDLRDGTIVGVEALLRWNHPTRGLLPPERVHRPRRGDRPDRADRHLGAAARLRTDAAVVRGARLAGMDVGQLLGAARWPSPGSRPRSARSSPRPSCRADLLRLELTETALLRVGHSAAVELERGQEPRRPRRHGRLRYRIRVPHQPAAAARSTSSRSTAAS